MDTSCRIESQNLTSQGIELAIESYSGSVNYIKYLVPLSAYNVVYQRIDFDENSYVTQTIGDTTYKSVNPNISKSHQLGKLLFIMGNAMTSLEKKYLAELFVVFQNKHTKEIFEHYRFTLKYDLKDDSVVSSGPAMIEATTKLFKSISKLGFQKKLAAKDIVLAIQIVSNESKPENYITPYFKNGCPPYVDPTDKNEHCSLGKISTGSHELEVLGKGNIFDSTENGSDIVSTSNQIYGEAFEVGNSSTASGIPTMEVVVSVAKKRKIDRDNEQSFEELINELSEEYDRTSMNCICQIFEQFANIPVVRCKFCRLHTHTSCIGYKKIKSITREFICFVCSKHYKTDFCDNRMKALKTETGRINLAIKRLVTMFCLVNSFITPYEIFQNVAPETKQRLHNVLKKADMIYFVDGCARVNLEILKMKLPELFHDYLVWGDRMECHTMSPVI